jgi:putative transposase
LLRNNCIESSLEVHGYCLMSNHVHLVVTPRSENSLANAIGYTHRQYARRFNKRHQRRGRLWQNRFYSCPLGEGHFLQALMYVDNNPVRAGLVEHPWQYLWSSAIAHTGKLDTARLIDGRNWMRISRLYDWETVARQRLDERIIGALRQCTYSGRPMGDARSLGEVASKFRGGDSDPVSGPNVMA